MTKLKMVSRLAIICLSYNLIVVLSVALNSSWVNRLAATSDFLDVDWLALEWNDFSVIFCHQSWDFTSGEHGVDGFDDSRGFNATPITLGNDPICLGLPLLDGSDDAVGAIRQLHHAADRFVDVE